MGKFDSQFKTILQSIGNTPLVRLEFGTKPTLLAKFEFANPGGSIKDRAALYMVEQAEKSGLLKPGGTIIEASSGNQGIALAMIGAVKGYKVIITVPDRTSSEKVAILRAYGAQVFICPNVDDHDDPRSYHNFAVNLQKNTPNSFMPDQYFNKNNPLGHYYSTGPEIWEQTKGQITHFIVGAGSCGTISGVGKFLKEKNPNIKVIGVDMDVSTFSSKHPRAYNTEGIGIDVISDTLNREVIDEILTVSDEQVFAKTRELAKKGLLVGLSSGAVMTIALEYCKKLTEDDLVVVICGDSGRSYLSKAFAETQSQTNVNVIKEEKNKEKVV